MEGRYLVLRPLPYPCQLSGIYLHRWPERWNRIWADGQVSVGAELHCGCLALFIKSFFFFSFSQFITITGISFNVSSLLVFGLLCVKFFTFYRNKE